MSGHREKSPLDSEVISRKIVMPDQTNPMGTLFGGVMMSWIDKVALMTAQRHAEGPAVTANIENIQFLARIQPGDYVLLQSRIHSVGRTSMEIVVNACRENPYSGERTLAVSACLTFVAIDPHHRPVSVPRLKVESDEDKLRFLESKIRAKIRARIKRRWPTHFRDAELAG